MDHDHKQTFHGRKIQNQGKDNSEYGNTTLPPLLRLISTQQTPSQGRHVRAQQQVRYPHMPSRIFSTERRMSPGPVNTVSPGLYRQLKRNSLGHSSELEYIGDNNQLTSPVSASQTILPTTAAFAQITRDRKTGSNIIYTRARKEGLIVAEGLSEHLIQSRKTIKVGLNANDSQSQGNTTCATSRNSSARRAPGGLPGENCRSTTHVPYNPSIPVQHDSGKTDNQTRNNGREIQCSPCPNVNDLITVASHECSIEAMQSPNGVGVNGDFCSPDFEDIDNDGSYSSDFEEDSGSSGISTPEEIPSSVDCSEETSLEHKPVVSPVNYVPGRVFGSETINNYQQGKQTAKPTFTSQERTLPGVVMDEGRVNDTSWSEKSLQMIIQAGSPRRTENEPTGRSSNSSLLSARNCQSRTSLRLKDLTSKDGMRFSESREELVYEFESILENGLAQLPEVVEKINMVNKYAPTGDDLDNSVYSLPIFKLENVVELPSCIGVVVMDGYFILLYKSWVEKKYIDEPICSDRLTVNDTHAICSINSTSCVAVLQMSRFITVVSTEQGLVRKYSILIDRPYSTLCCLSVNRSSWPLFGTILSVANIGASQQVHVISANHSQNPHAYQFKNTVKVLEVHNTRNISAICGLPESKLVAACSDSVKCFRYDTLTVQLIWTVPVSRAVTDVISVKLSESEKTVHENKDKMSVLACVQNDYRVMRILDGEVMEENILPGSPVVKPSQISVRGSRILVREFNQSIWQNYIHEF